MEESATEEETVEEESAIVEESTEEGATEEITEEEITEEEIAEEESLEEPETEEESEPEVTYNIAKTNSTAYATTSLNVRSLPSTSGRKIGALAAGQEVTVTGRCIETGWYRIEYNGGEAFVSDKYITDEITIIEDEPVPVESAQPRAGSSTIQGEAGVSDAMLQAVSSHYANLPANVRSRFESSGWRVLVCSDIASRNSFGFSILALTNYGEKTIYIDNRETAKTAIYHEMCHYADYAWKGYFQSASGTFEFGEIYEAEVEAYCAGHLTASQNTATLVEYFAEAGASCITDPSWMQSACPRTYAYIMSILSQI